jgi:hypothetical protein
MGKYTKLRGKLPATNGSAPDWFRSGQEKWLERVDEEKKRLLGGAENPEDANVAFFARLFADAKVEKRAVEAELHAVNTRLEALRQLLAKMLLDEGQELVKLADGSSVGLKDVVFVSVEDLERLLESLDPKTRRSLLAIQNGRLKGHVSDLLVDGRIRVDDLGHTIGKDAPKGLRVTLKTTAELYGARGGEENGDE